MERQAWSIAGGNKIVVGDWSSHRDSICRGCILFHPRGKDNCEAAEMNYQLKGTVRQCSGRVDKHANIRV